MSKVKDPRTKKRLSLKRDHRPLKPAQDAAALRKSIAKAVVHQRLRRAEHVALHGLEALDAPEAAELAVREARLARRGTRPKRRAVSLAQHLDLKAGRGTRRMRSAAAKRTRGVRASARRRRPATRSAR